MLRSQILAMILVFAAGALFVFLTARMTLFANARRDAPGLIPQSAKTWELFSLLMFFGVLTLLLTLVFRFIPDASVRWRDALAGGVATGILFSLGQWMLATYLGRAQLAVRYGAAGTLIILLIWIYLWAYVLVMGAVFTEALSESRHLFNGSGVGATRVH